MNTQLIIFTLYIFTLLFPVCDPAVCPHQIALVPDEYKENCGRLYIKKDACLQLGCCWVPAKEVESVCGASGATGKTWTLPLCYYPNRTNIGRQLYNQKVPIVPNIVHLIKMDKRPLPLYIYLNFLSIIQNIKPDTVYIHHVVGQPELENQYWNEIISHSVVKLVNLPEKISIFGHEPNLNDFAHRADIVR